MPNPFRFPFAPVLLAAIVPIWHLWQGITALPLEDVLRPAVVLAVAFALILVLARWALRDWHRAGLLTTLLVLVLLVATKHFVLFLALAAATLLIAAVERGKASANGTVLFNMFAVVEFLGALYQVVPAAFVANGPSIEDASLAGVALNERPSIVHIVLDGYASRQVLAQVYGYDNAAFEAALQRRGFTVMKRAFSPHNQTLFTMAAVFNGAFVDAAALPDAENWRLRLQLGRTANAGAVPQALRAQGYRFAYTESGFGPLRFGDGARPVSEAAGLNSVESGLVSRVWPRSRFATMHYDAAVRSAFEPANVAGLTRPFFYFQHVLSPHPPFSLTADGEHRKTISPTLADASHFVRQSPERRKRYVAGYVEKLEFTNRALLRQLARLPDGPLVVIVHGDHGGGALFDQESLARSCALERFATLFAVYSNVPRVQSAFAGLADRPFNLVNTYRVLFAALSDSEIAPLPDVSFFNPWSAPRALARVPAQTRAAPCAEPPGAPAGVARE